MDGEEQMQFVRVDERVSGRIMLMATGGGGGRVEFFRVEIVWAGNPRAENVGAYFWRGHFSSFAMEAFLGSRYPEESAFAVLRKELGRMPVCTRLLDGGDGDIVLGARLDWWCFALPGPGVILRPS